MEQKIDYTSITPPCKMAAKMYMVRLGKILFGLSLIALIVSILPTVSFLMIAAYFLVWVIIVIFSLGTIFVTNPDFANSLISGTDFLANVTTTLHEASLYLLPFTIIATILAITFLALDKTDRHVARITFASIFLAIAIIMLIIRIVSMGQ